MKISLRLKVTLFSAEQNNLQTLGKVGCSSFRLLIYNQESLSHLTLELTLADIHFIHGAGLPLGSLSVKKTVSKSALKFTEKVKNEFVEKNAVCAFDLAVINILCPRN